MATSLYEHTVILLLKFKNLIEYILLDKDIYIERSFGARNYRSIPNSTINNGIRTCRPVAITDTFNRELDLAIEGNGN